MGGVGDFKIPRRHAGMAIGRHGVNMKLIKDTTGVDPIVRIDPKSDMCQVTLVGPESGKASARAEILRKVLESARRDGEFNQELEEEFGDAKDSCLLAVSVPVGHISL